MVKLRLIALLALLVFWMAASQIPAWVLGTTPTIQVVRPSIELYTPQIVTGGSLQSGKVMEVYLSQGVIPSQVYVKPGDWVEQGALMARVDTEATQAIANLTSPTQTAKLPESIPEEYAALAQAFGLTEQINEFFESSTAQAPSNEVFEEIGEEVIAPVGGVVTDVQLVEGRLSQAGTLVATISQSGCDSAIISVNEYDLSLIEVGDRVSISGVGLGEGQYSGYISRIYPTAEKKNTGLTTSTMVDMEVSIDSPDSRLLPGLSVSATIELEAPTPKVVVPYEAVGQDENNCEFVYILEDAQVKKRIIDVDMELLQGMAVSSGLDGNELILYDMKNYDPEQIYRYNYLGNWGETP